MANNFSYRFIVSVCQNLPKKNFNADRLLAVGSFKMEDGFDPQATTGYYSCAKPYVGLYITVLIIGSIGFTLVNFLCTFSPNCTRNTALQLANCQQIVEYDGGWDYVSELQPVADILFIPQMIYEYGERRWNHERQLSQLAWQPVHD
jgi:hypothetical protein